MSVAGNKVKADTESAKGAAVPSAAVPGAAPGATVTLLPPVPPLTFSAGAAPKTVSPEDKEKRERVLAAFAQQEDFEAFIKNVEPTVPAKDKDFFQSCVNEERARRKLVSSMATTLESVFRAKPVFSTLCGRLDNGTCSVQNLSSEIAKAVVYDDEGSEVDVLVAAQILLRARDEIGPNERLLTALVADLVIAVNSTKDQPKVAAASPAPGKP